MRRRITLVLVGLLVALGATSAVSAVTPSVVHVARQWGGGSFGNGSLTVYPNDGYSAISGYRVLYSDSTGCLVWEDVPLGSWVVDPTLNYAQLDMATECGRLRVEFRGYGSYYPYPAAGVDPSGSGAGVLNGRAANIVITIDGETIGQSANGVLLEDVAVVA